MPELPLPNLRALLPIDETTLEAWLTATEAAEYLGVSRSTINNMTKQIDSVTGKHYGTRRGALWLFTREELDRWKITP